ncbi:MAG: hypothetical protein MMC23_010104 [Stictis urceolatum]|nr:hypothetical protein [Stictis urceolata]
MANLEFLREKSHMLVQRLQDDDDMPVPCISDFEIGNLRYATDIEWISKLIAGEPCWDYLRSGLKLAYETLGEYSQQSKAQSKRALFSMTKPEDGPQRNSLDLDQKIFRLKALAGFRLLTSLYQSFPNIREDLDVKNLVCYSAFTDPTDPWTTPESSGLAAGVLDIHNGPKRSGTLTIASALLDQCVCPAFQKNENIAVTRLGRKAAYINDLPSDIGAIDRPWRTKNPFVVTVFRWSLQQFESSIIETTWGKLVPPILILLDDETSEVKVKGCELLQILLELLSPELLRKTGLFDVFAATLLHMLTYLPPLILESESLQILRGAYVSLYSLVNTLFPGPTTKPKAEAYDKIMRTGILNGLQHSGEYVYLSEYLIKQVAELINTMGIHSVKHLKNIIPILVTNISNPFALSYTPLLIVSIETLQTLILNDWPRVFLYKGDILMALSMCWCRVGEERPPIAGLAAEIEEYLRTTTRLLMASLTNEKGAAEEIELVLQGNSALQGLLSTSSSARRT